MYNIEMEMHELNLLDENNPNKRKRKKSKIDLWERGTKIVKDTGAGMLKSGKRGIDFVAGGTKGLKDKFKSLTPKTPAEEVSSFIDEFSIGSLLPSEFEELNE